MRIYLWKELRAAGVPYVRKHVTTLEQRAEFPMHFFIGPNRVAWLADEVDHWVEERVRNRRSVPTLPTEEIPQLPNPRQDTANCAVTAEVAHILAQEAARRGITTLELIRRVIETHDSAVRTTRRRGATEGTLNT
jgi:prophage regulatory protein